MLMHPVKIGILKQLLASLQGFYENRKITVRVGWGSGFLGLPWKRMSGKNYAKHMGKGDINNGWDKISDLADRYQEKIEQNSLSLWKRAFYTPKAIIELNAIKQCSDEISDNIENLTNNPHQEGIKLFNINIFKKLKVPSLVNRLKVIEKMLHSVPEFFLSANNPEEANAPKPGFWARLKIQREMRNLHSIYKTWLKAHNNKDNKGADNYREKYQNKYNRLLKNYSHCPSVLNQLNDSYIKLYYGVDGQDRLRQLDNDYKDLLNQLKNITSNEERTQLINSFREKLDEGNQNFTYYQENLISDESEEIIEQTEANWTQISNFYREELQNLSNNSFTNEKFNYKVRELVHAPAQTNKNEALHDMGLNELKKNFEKLKTQLESINKPAEYENLLNNFISDFEKKCDAFKKYFVEKSHDSAFNPNFNRDSRNTEELAMADARNRELIALRTEWKKEIRSIKAELVALQESAPEEEKTVIQLALNSINNFTNMLVNSITSIPKDIREAREREQEDREWLDRISKDISESQTKATNLAKERENNQKLIDTQDKIIARLQEANMRLKMRNNSTEHINNQASTTTDSASETPTRVNGTFHRNSNLLYKVPCDSNRMNEGFKDGMTNQLG